MLVPDRAAAGERRASLAAALLTALVPLAAYLATRAPTISWANGGADGGELAAAIATWGIAHPPAYPTYTIVGVLWSSLPTDATLGGRLVLLSVLSGALACAILGLTTFLLSRRAGSPRWCAVAAGVVGGSAWGIGSIAWSQSVIVEVYAHGMVWLGLATLALLRLDPDAHARHYVVAGLTLGLGFGALPQIVVLVPATLALVPSWLRQTRRVVKALAGVGGGLLGLSVYSYLPMRAGAAPITWGDPASPAGLAAIMTAELYREIPASIDTSERLRRVLDSVALLGVEVGILVPLSLVGTAILVRRQRAAAGLLLGLLALTVVARAGYPAEGNIVYLLPATYAACVLAGVGLAHAAGAARAQWRRYGIVIPVVVGIAVLARAPLTLATVDASHDLRAEQFAREVRDTLPPGALVVSDHDETTFPLWYHQALGRRPDLVILDTRLLTHRWYQENIARQHPDLDARAIRPGGLTALGRPIYVIGFSPGSGEPPTINAR